MRETDKSLFETTLTGAAETIGVPLTAEQVAQCLRYTEMMLAVNEHTNLTRITDPTAVAIKHFADSLTVLLAAPKLAQGARVADVGTGAGFPGLVLKIARPDLRITLMDSLGKRLTFLNEVIAELKLQDIKTAHFRAEDAGRSPVHRDSYALVTARAVAAMPRLLEWCAPLVSVGGVFVAMKTAGVDEEKAEAARAAKLLQMRPTADQSLTLPAIPGEEEAAQRRLLVYTKIMPTPARFPRKPAEIQTNPL